jgi:hypothetical protein
VSSYYNMCVLILLYMCPHTYLYVFSCYYTCVLILVHIQDDVVEVKVCVSPMKPLNLYVTVIKTKPRKKSKLVT